MKRISRQHFLKSPSTERLVITEKFIIIKAFHLTGYKLFPRDYETGSAEK